MTEIVLGRYRPSPGQRAEDLEIPGPGLYEADFSVPDWLVPDFDKSRAFSFKHDGKRITHLRSFVKGDKLTVRFKVADEGPANNVTPQTEFLLGPLTVGIVVRAIAGAVFGTLVVLAINGIVQALREVRKLGETPAGIGLAALGVAGALVLVAKGR